MRRRALYFAGPGAVEVREEPLDPPGEGQALAETVLSAISPGTEMLIYRGQFPPGMALDETISSLQGDFSYPFRYGYACVGRVAECGPGVDRAWMGRMAFSFQPHASHFVAPISDLIPLPSGVSPEDAVCLPNMETAVNFVHDGGPLIGEQVAVFGQGIVGLLTAALLVRFPLSRLITVDSYPERRRASLALGATQALDPAAGIGAIREALGGEHYTGADLVYELSGSPAALDMAIGVAGFNGRVVIGSWYGQKRADLDLGGAFHRSRVRLISSQVSSIDPALRGRWTAARRFEAAWEMIRQVNPARFITQRFGMGDAAKAYRLIDEQPEQTIQVALVYD